MAACIVCQNLSKHYGRVVALDGVDLAIEPGVVGLLGPNGAGKTTLISILLGQTPATSGRATVLGFDVGRQRRDVRARVGFVPENDCLIPELTGTGYVCYAGRLAGMSFGDAMQRAHQVLDYVELDEARYRPAEQYSTGMKQRLKLAQALVHDPDLLLLDEPTNGMDPQGRQVMLSLITDLGRAGISVVLCSHLLPDVERVCDRVIIMGKGQVLTSGHLDDLSRPHPTLCTVTCLDPTDTFTSCLTQRKVRIHDRSDGTFSLELPEEGRLNLVLEAAVEAGVKVRGLQPQRSSLEERFLAAIRRQEEQ